MKLPFSYFSSHSAFVRMQLLLRLPVCVAVPQNVFSPAGNYNVSDIYAHPSICLGNYYMEHELVICKLWNEFLEAAKVPH